MEDILKRQPAQRGVCGPSAFFWAQSEAEVIRPKRMFNSRARCIGDITYGFPDVVKAK
jgi:hypothetical protein